MIAAMFTRVNLGNRSALNKDTYFLDARLFEKTSAFMLYLSGAQLLPLNEEVENMALVRMLEGENDFAGGVEFHKRAKRALDSLPSGESITLDLGGFYLDSSLVGTLLAIHVSCAKRNVKMEITNISQQTLKILELSGLSRALGLNAQQ
ncbi:MAG TPA: STAS domain-containing protein [bacterium]|nr:STAS domain-containing protein [bacterium]